ncbi:unnamed protein product [Medioppia subpectinata]|uniref:RNA helicase n=1 Tax=Medioppia subpectinata TaxID=1979941 RepID=A0A7R9LKQ4_9ACAR|nr:unnamed protein product [Medioppia subpectinata]CAG2119667.1 unnamed protein product [Medioppia subpectinata]
MSGICYRLYTKEEYNEFRDHAIPEIQRCNLANVLLHIIAIGINDVLNFDFMDKPSEDLTAVGTLMVIFPVEPKLSKMIVTSKSMGCTKIWQMKSIRSSSQVKAI